MANDSSTGGPLSPAASPAPLEGAALNTFLQNWLVGITGLPGSMVRPRWQAEPPNIPDAGTAWAAIGITDRKADAYPYIGHDPTGNGADDLQRHETLDLLASFYDLSADGQADYYAALLRDGMAIAQNRETLEVAGFNVLDVGDMTVVPSLLKSRWLYRVDLSFRLRRAIVRTYPVLNVESGVIQIVEQDAAGNDTTVNLNVT